MIESVFVLRGHCESKPLGMTGSASALQGHCGTKVSEEKLGIRRETGWDKVLFSFQRGQTANAGSPAFRIREIDLQLIAGFWLHCKNYTDLDTFHLSHTYSYILYISYIYLVHFVHLVYLVHLVHLVHTSHIFRISITSRTSTPFL